MSNRSSISRAHLTAWWLDTLTDLGYPVGDANVPTVAHGWQGQPNDTSTFIPWLSSIPGTARPTGGSFGDSASEHVLSYAVSFNTVTREQVEWLSDSVRKSLVNTERVIVDCADFGMWKMQQVKLVTIGGVMRVRTSFPDYFIQTDAYDIWVSKERE